MPEGFADLDFQAYPYPKMYANAYILPRNPHGMCRVLLEHLK
jgi:hypothetical protein